jgi:integrase/recombinase XerD
MSPSFASIWASDLTAFLEFKRALGYPYRRAEFTLRELDRFLVGQRHGRGNQRLHESILTWLARRPGRKPVSVAIELAVVRQFYAFLRRQGRRGLREPSWPKLPAISNHVPYVFSTQEVRKLLYLTTMLGWHPFRRIMYRTLLLVLYCTGLRFGEALRLRMRDVNVVNGTLFILESKGRSRWVPCHRSLCRELRRYLVARKVFTPAAGPDDRFFVGTSRTKLPTTRLPSSTASETVRRLLRTAGLKPAAGRLGPRPYDFRHAFALHRLTRWYRAGVDLHARLPWLSAYMGHDDLLGTEAYLTATPELLALAGGRFRRRYVTARRPR